MSSVKKQINTLCNASIEDFCNQRKHIDTPDGPLIHIDNGGSVLAVGHLDTVATTIPKWRGKNVQCTQLDDRLGVWTILNLLPKMTKIPYDILLTDNEESGMSTASHFKPDKQYNWIFEFDRAGEDCVLYDYEDDQTIATISEYGWEIGNGTFTDICSLEHLGIKAFNFGTGYYNQHTPQCHANITKTINNAKRFISLFEDLHSIKLPHTQVSRGIQRGYGWETDYEDYWQSERQTTVRETEYQCYHCDSPLYNEWRYCPYCGEKT